MYTKEQICSAACLRLGCSEIVGFNEGTTEAKVCASVYPLVLENLLSYRWNFPKTAVSLARLTETPLRGYKYFYVWLLSVLAAAAGIIKNQNSTRSLMGKLLPTLNSRC